MHGALLLIAVAAIPMAFRRLDSVASVSSVPAPVGTSTGAPAVSTELFGPPPPTAPLAGDPAAATQPTATTTPIVSLTHVVQEGETVNSIAAVYGIDPQYLIWNNFELSDDPNMITIGETLLIPGSPGIVYDVRLGDTVSAIAGTYGVDPSAVIAYGPNNLTSPDLITEGMVLLIPGGTPPPPPPPPPAEEPAIEPELPPAYVEAPPAAEEPVRAVAAVAVPSDFSGYIWPVAGAFWSGFGPRWGSFHKGVDLGAAYGTPVVAAAAGQVVLATYSNNGYGNYVIVRHADGSETLYAHLSEYWVGLGQYVGQGEAVGAVGCTGRCNGDHLHFEVHIGGSPVDPMAYLP